MPLHRAAPYLEKTFECRNAPSIVVVVVRSVRERFFFFVLFIYTYTLRIIIYMISIGIAEFFTRIR